jgi:hypothetical protein
MTTVADTVEILVAYDYQKSGSSQERVKSVFGILDHPVCIIILP